MESLDLNRCQETGHMTKKGMLINGLAISCTLYIVSIILEHKYDWDLDHFMYFGSRLANGELPFVNEYDDKTLAVHALFLIPFWLKSIRAWYIISIAAAATAGYFFYKTLLKFERQGKGKGSEGQGKGWRQGQGRRQGLLGEEGRVKSFPLRKERKRKASSLSL